VLLLVFFYLRFLVAGATKTDRDDHVQMGKK
jgi:hypothetical protein